MLVILIVSLAMNLIFGIATWRCFAEKSRDFNSVIRVREQLRSMGLHLMNDRLYRSTDKVGQDVCFHSEDRTAADILSIAEAVELPVRKDTESPYGVKNSNA